LTQNKYGQTLWSIAVTYKTTIKQIQQLNNLPDTTVQPGQKLLVLKGATQPAPRAFFTPTVNPITETPTSETFRESFSRDKQKNTLGIVSIAIAAMFLGALFALMTRKKQI
jgi:LysM repeat protein